MTKFVRYAQVHVEQAHRQLGDAVHGYPGPPAADSADAWKAARVKEAVHELHEALKLLEDQPPA